MSRIEDTPEIRGDALVCRGRGYYEHRGWIASKRGRVGCARWRILLIVAGGVLGAIGVHGWRALLAAPVGTPPASISAVPIPLVGGLWLVVAGGYLAASP